MLEIYNEVITDLLVGSGDPLSLHQRPQSSEVYVEGLHDEVVHTGKLPGWRAPSCGQGQTGPSLPLARGASQASLSAVAAARSCMVHALFSWIIELLLLALQQPQLWTACWAGWDRVLVIPT